MSTSATSEPSSEPQVVSATDPSLAPTAPAAGNAMFTAEDLERVRKEEKDKLYTRIAEANSRIKELEAEVSSKRTPEEQTRAELGALRTKVEELTASLNQAQEAAREEKKQAQVRERQLGLKNYLETKLREADKAGKKYIPELIGGTTEAEIDASIEASIKERDRLLNQFKAEENLIAASEVPVPTTGQPAPVTPSGTTTTVAPGPASFPTAPNAAPPSGATPADVMAEIPAVTTEEAVRSGAWAQRRGTVLETLKRGGNPAGTMSNLPRVVAAPTVTVPHGLPTPPARQPHMPVQPPAPVPGAQPEPAPIPVAAPPTGASAEMRRLAAESAHRALGNPANHSRNAAVVGGLPRTHAEYALAPNTNVSFEEGGRHPMDRST